jgi:hypothetical protein
VQNRLQQLKDVKVRLFLGVLQEKRLPRVVVRRSIIHSRFDLRPDDKKLDGLGYNDLAREKLLTLIR